MPYKPPFQITPAIVHRISQIATLLGEVQQSPLVTSPQLRKQNRIRTIQGTLAIEGNTLTVAQITAILEVDTPRAEATGILGSKTGLN
ncbi:hypothetical protein VB712_14890 [Spirulina sp. CCNP1310]|uniref:hypothetical protein n=1 Tax=Spirulina sp. CCNP1310 TaxID=3110249 RepID=UPI002B1EADE4|nr:hypothetical protein [Spirulina sp. CCNP1310]MEA5420517.1 hypothetical protein [Spirulina sp. CCNP1310]